MLKRILILHLLLASLLFTACTTVAPDNSSTIIGTIYSSSYSPIFGATAIVSSTTASTNSEGTYTLGNISAGSKIVSLSNSGYTTSYRKVTTRRAKTSYAELAILAPLDSKTTTIGNGGGEVTNTSSSLKLVIPSGALSSNTDIILTEVPLLAAPYPPPANFQFIAVIVYINPSTKTLSSQATLSMPNLTYLADGTGVDFYHLDTATVEWQKITDAQGAVDTDTHTINAKIRNFGWIAAIVPIAPAAGEISGKITSSDGGAGIANANVWTSYLFVLTDSSGNYTIENVPTGEAKVIAVSQGYYMNSVEATVNSGATTTVNLALSPIVYVGTIEGTVTNSFTGAKLSSSRVALSDGTETLTNSQGYYSFNNKLEDSYIVTAYKNDYFPNSSSADLFAGQTLTVNLSLTPSGSATTWSDGFETERGWTQEALDPSITNWQRMEDTVLSATKDTLFPDYVQLPDLLGYLPQPKTGNYCYWYGQNIYAMGERGCYIYQQKSGDSSLSGGTTANTYHYGYLVSPSIDIRNFAYATLSFDTWWEIESQDPTRGYDEMKIEVSSNDGLSWTKVAILNPVQDPTGTKEAYAPYSSGGYNQDGIWVNHSFNLTPYVGNIIKLRFTFNTKDELYNGFRGWFIDNVSIAPMQISGVAISSASVEKRPDKGNLVTTPRK